MLKKILGAAFLWSAVGTVMATTVAQLQQLYAEQPIEAAYETATEMLDDCAGEPGFDFIYALIAIEAKHPELATYALERMLLLEPGNMRVRLELGRAYFLSKNFQAAEKEFATVLAVNPPQAVRKNIATFLTAIKQQQGVLKPNWHAIATAKFGFDSNINSAVDDESINIGNSTLSLAASSQQQEALFRDLTARAVYIHPFNQLMAANLNAYYNIRTLDSHKEFNQSGFGARAAFVYSSGKNIVSLPLAYDKAFVNTDGGSDRELQTATVEWVYKYNVNNRSMSFMQLGDIDYSHSDTQNTSLLALGSSFSHTFKTPAQLTVGVFYGEESAEKNAGKHNGYNRFGINGSYQWIKNPNSIFYANLNWQFSEYKAPQPVFAAVRRDHQYRTALGHIWQPSAKFSNVFELSYLHNDSSLSINTYDRWVLSYQVVVAF